MDLNLSKESSELLASCLNNENLQQLETKTTYCMCDTEFVPFLIKRMIWLFTRTIKVLEIV